MSPDRMAEIGFQHPARNARLKTMRKIACAELLMTITLVLSIAIAATAVSFGIARADTLGAIVEGRNRHAGRSPPFWRCSSPAWAASPPR